MSQFTVQQHFHCTECHRVTDPYLTAWGEGEKPYCLVHAPEASETPEPEEAERSEAPGTT